MQTLLDFGASPNYKDLKVRIDQVIFDIPWSYINILNLIILNSLLHVPQAQIVFTWIYFSFILLSAIP